MNKTEVIESLVPYVRVQNVGFRQWPFLGKAAFRKILQEDTNASLASFILQFHLQDESEQMCRETIEKNRRGYMSSHAKTATAIAQAMLSGEEIFPPSGGFKADGMRFDTMMEYAQHVGSRYAESTLKEVIRYMRQNDESLDRTCRLIAPGA